MYFIQSIILVGIAIGLWIMAPILMAIAGTVCIIVVIRFVLKEHADAQEINKRNS